MHTHRGDARAWFDSFILTIPRTDSCIIWPFSGNSDGRAQLWERGRFRLVSHLVLGDRPGNLHALHSCDTPACINPRHLRWGTASENMHDMVSRNRRNQASGIRNGNSRLTPEQVAKIRQDTRSNVAVAKDYGVSNPTISRIRLGQTWTS